jgi:hypothetical protein
VTVLALAAVVLAAGSVATPSTGSRVGVFWFGVDLQPSCSLDVPRVEHEVRRIFEAMGVEIDWTVSATEAVRQGGEEITVIALATDARKRTQVMGATMRGFRSVWVYCSAVARALDLDPRTSGSAPLLSQAVGRVVAHEIVHVLAPALPHSGEGLMAARWAPRLLVDPVLDADAATRVAIQRRLATNVATSAPMLPPRNGVPQLQGRSDR